MASQRQAILSMVGERRQVAVIQMRTRPTPMQQPGIPHFMQGGQQIHIQFILMQMVVQSELQASQ